MTARVVNRYLSPAENRKKRFPRTLAPRYHVCIYVRESPPLKWHTVLSLVTGRAALKATRVFTVSCRVVSSLSTLEVSFFQRQVPKHLRADVPTERTTVVEFQRSVARVMLTRALRIELVRSLAGSVLGLCPLVYFCTPYLRFIYTRSVSRWKFSARRQS